MKTEAEIQRAHDILLAVLLKDVPNPFKDEGSIKGLNAAASVLCWVLEHDHNPQFPKNLEQIERYLKERGYVLQGGDDGGYFHSE